MADADAGAAATPPPKPERHSLTLDQRRALRRWANNQTIRPSHRACIEWFYSQYGQQISQSTVSHSLSPKYSRLDGDNPPLSGSRLRFGNWPDVEKLVLMWFQQVQAQGRNPTNDELGDKAKAIFSALPRYKDETPPEFSPGWIHRFKKRYGLLVRRQRRSGPGGDGPSPAEDINYLADCVPRFMTISPETSPAAIKESVLRVVGVEASLQTCALVRDEILRRNSAGAAASAGASVTATAQAADAVVDQSLYQDEDPEVVLQNALRQMQQEEAAAEATAAAVREEREKADRGLMSTPTAPRSATAGRFTPFGTSDGKDELTLTPIPGAAPVSGSERPLRCPFCVNQRMLRTIKEAVEHLSSHVVV